MKAILATNHLEVNKYIIKTRQDILIIAQADTANHCLETVRKHKPDLVITSDALIGNETWDQFISFLYSLKEAEQKTMLLCLFTQMELTKRQMSELHEKGIRYLNKPISEKSLSWILNNLTEKGKEGIEPKILAIWSPKPGDGSSLVTEAASYVLYDYKESEDRLIGVLDLNLLRPFLKYRYHFDESIILDDLMPYINSGTLNPEILQTGACSAGKRKGLKFIGGIARPELYRRYGHTHLTYLIETAEKTFHKTVIDAGGDLYNMGTVTALKNADVILAVLQPNYISKICLRHSLALLPSMGINPNKVKIVINKFADQGPEDPAMIMTGINSEFLGTLADLGKDANYLCDSSLSSSAGNRNASTFFANLKDILIPTGLPTSKDENRKGKLYKMITRGVG